MTTFEVKRIEANDWVDKFSELAHKLVFEKHKPAEWDRIDFALLVVQGEKLIGYATCREHDSKTLYLQYGGAFPGTRETSMSLPAYIRLIEWCRENYEKVTTVIENDNIVYLKFAMRVGFRIVGLRIFKETVLLEHELVSNEI